MGEGGRNSPMGMDQTSRAFGTVIPLANFEHMTIMGRCQVGPEA